MAASDEAYSFVISVDDFDKNALPPQARTPGTDEFNQEVSKFFEKEFASFRGSARIVVDARIIHVSWQSDPNQPHPLRFVQSKLERGEYAEAIRLLEILRRYQPHDVHVLYNLGMALSDAGHFAEAEQHLRHAVEVAPDHVNALVLK